MNEKFDELTKLLAQSVTRRGALKQFSIGITGIMLAMMGLANKAHAGHCTHQCWVKCKKQFPIASDDFQLCYSTCVASECGY